MKQFKDYLSESAKKYDFRIKIAGEFSSKQADTMKALLEKFQISGFRSSGKTPIQELPLDFPKIKNAEVCIYEATLDYPATAWELQEYLSSSMGITKDRLVVRCPGEPTEAEQVPHEQRTEALLNDGEYKESPNVKFEDFYGDTYNTGFVKELNDILKLQRKARGEEIPENVTAKYNTDTPAGTSGVLKQASDPRTTK
jgi:hypothetical protein